MTTTTTGARFAESRRYASGFVVKTSFVFQMQVRIEVSRRVQKCWRTTTTEASIDSPRSRSPNSGQAGDDDGRDRQNWQACRKGKGRLVGLAGSRWAGKVKSLREVCDLCWLFLPLQHPITSNREEVSHSGMLSRVRVDTHRAAAGCIHRAVEERERALTRKPPWPRKTKTKHIKPEPHTKPHRGSSRLEYIQIARSCGGGELAAITRERA